MARTGDPTRTGLGVSLGAVAAGSMVANICTYAIHLTATRWWLDTAEYGELAVGLSAMLVLGVVAMAVQAVVARSVVRHADPARIARVTWQATAFVIGLAVLGAPFAAWVTSMGVGTALAALSGAVPLVLVGAGQGVLQGRSAFRLLAWVLAAVGVLRTVPVIGVLAAGAGPVGALVAGAAGTVAAAAMVGWAVRMSGPANPTEWPYSTDRLSALDVLGASGVQLVLIVAASIDLLLSRTALSAGDAGVYALGAIATKVAFWLPQAIGVVVYPQLSDPALSANAFRRAVGVVVGLGVVLTGLAGLAGPMIPILIGDDYRTLVPILWVFAWTGSALAVLQVALLAAIARDRPRIALATWAVISVEVLVIVTCAHSVVALAGVAAVSATVAAAGTCWYCMSGPVIRR
ncbi:polysaccharide biosynthesis protein [Gordonia sp. CPCC 205515]|uniref:polysaccharide biosynthesis protein n=1 Tax=Gordonia sp. CPCC 205515 TaxID=3140791 RepID=UPI003AF3F971